MKKGNVSGTQLQGKLDNPPLACLSETFLSYCLYTVFLLPIASSSHQLPEVPPLYQKKKKKPSLSKSLPSTPLSD